MASQQRIHDRRVGHLKQFIARFGQGHKKMAKQAQVRHVHPLVCRVLLCEPCASLRASPVAVFNSEWEIKCFRKKTQRTMSGGQDLCNVDGFARQTDCLDFWTGWDGAIGLASTFVSDLKAS
eukprot:6195169-Pleurochrysis_carterae.AAC.1